MDMVITMAKKDTIVLRSHIISPERVTEVIERTTKNFEEELRKKFATRLKTLRTNAGLTQKQLAERSGMKDSVIARYETGGALPRPRTIEKLASALEVPPYVLDTGSTNKHFDYDYFNAALFRNYGVNVKQIKPGFIKFSMPGNAEIVLSTEECDTLYEFCIKQTEKAFKTTMQNYLVNLFLREIYTDYDKANATNSAETTDNK